MIAVAIEPFAKGLEALLTSGHRYGADSLGAIGLYEVERIARSATAGYPRCEHVGASFEPVRWVGTDEKYRRWTE